MSAGIGRLVQWFDNEAVGRRDAGIDWLRVMPFIALHVAVLAVFWVGVSPVALLAAALMYAVRMFAITGFYHRYFSHHGFKTSRWLQFLFAVIAATAAQRGPLWWASHHRHHHRHADSAEDAHAPSHGFLWSHMGWFLDGAHFAPRRELIRDFSPYPELRFLDRFDVLPPLLAALGLFALGSWLESAMPALQTNGWQLLVGATSSPPSCSTTPPSPSIPLPIASVRAATPRATAAATTCGSPCSPLAKAGTTITIISPGRRGRASTGGKST
jgi:stearoyl-CoA desaturase (delta-9 desaturase)